MVSSKWSCCPRALQGSWGGSWGNCQGLQAPACRATPRLLPHLSVLDGRWLVRADLLSLGRAPFSSYLSLLALHCFLSPGCGRTGLEQEGELCLQWACKSCLYCWHGWRYGRGLQERCTGTFPRLRGARAMWPLHLLAACITLFGLCYCTVLTASRFVLCFIERKA